MPDFRRLGVQALKWFPQSRKTVPVTPVRVQVPPSPCAISLLPGRYAIELTLAGHAAHPAFARWVAEVEQHARQHATPTTPDLTWFTCTDVGSLLPTLKVSGFDDTRFFDAKGAQHMSPPDIGACTCLLELTGAWTSDAGWGLRWKVLEVKELRVQMTVPCLLDLDESDYAQPAARLSQPARRTFTTDAQPARRTIATLHAPPPAFIDDD